MKIHIPEFRAMAKCNHLDHGPIDIDLGPDFVEVVRCRDCINAEPLERNCELNENFYMHCRLWRGEECKNVWHKYKRYYRDYSLVQHDDFCGSGERKEGTEC